MSSHVKSFAQILDVMSCHCQMTCHFVTFLDMSKMILYKNALNDMTSLVKIDVVFNILVSNQYDINK